MRFRFLGPVEVTEQDRQVSIGGARQRRLLCSLVAGCGDVVSIERLAEEIWDNDERPVEPAKAVRSYVARLRRALGDNHTVILTKAPGYVFVAGGHLVDITEFEHLVQSAEESSTPATKAAMLRRALGLWRGGAYDEFADLRWIRPEVERLERLRGVATEELFDAELAKGSGTSIVPDLDFAIERFPFNERLRGFLMEALWRGGRSVEAVRSFQVFREFLAEETGLEPRESLQRLERTILAGEAPPEGRSEMPLRISPDRPTGNVTFLMTDIIGAEKLWEQDPVGMDKSVRLHDETVRQLVESRGGFVIRTTNEGTLSAFSSALDAARVAVEAQVALSSQDRGVGNLPVRMGLHAGVTYERDGDYRGPVVNRTALTTLAGSSGHILASSIVAELISGAELQLRELGPHRLEDLTLAEHIWQVVVPGLDTAPPKLQTTRVTAGNLPAETTTFVGRREELDKLVELMGKTRLLTLTGPGGVGKTRLALQVAGRVSSSFGGGVWLVDLSAISESELVPEAVVETLGLSRSEGLTSTDVIISALKFTPVLLILDTCERVLDGVAELVEAMLTANSTITVIATSREILDLPAETARVVGSLGPDAVQLFQERAATTTAAFQATDETLPLVEEICGRLDGLPLAIELAAARVASLDLNAIASELGRTPVALGSRGRGRAERHRSLETTIAWSYELLDPIDRALFDRLSVFTGSFASEAVRGTCAGGPVTGHDIDGRLEQLVMKSMVEMYGSATGRRFRLLDTLQAFSQARLDERGETDEWRMRHATYYAEWAEQTAGRLHGPGEAALRRQLVAETTNIRRAMEYAIDSADLDTAAGILIDIGVLLRQGSVSALARPAERLLELKGLDDHPRACEVLHEAAIHLFFGFMEEGKARQIVERGLAIRETSLLVSLRGVINIWTGDASAGFPDCERGWQLAVAEHDELSQIRLAPPMIHSMANSGDLELALQRWHLMRDLAATYPASSAFLATIEVTAVLFTDHNPDLVREALESARKVGVELGLRSVISRAGGNLAEMEFRTGRPQEALEIAVEVVIGDYDLGSSQLDVVRWMHQVVVILSLLGRAESAVVLHHAIPAVGIMPREDATQHMIDAKHKLGPNAYDQAVSRGQAFDFPDLIDWLRNLPSQP